MNQVRRLFLRASMASGTIAIAAGAGLLTPRAVMADWPKNAFETTGLNKAIQIINGNLKATNSKDIILETPDIAENGAVVSVTVKTSIPKAEKITVLVAENGRPLAASYALGKQTEGFITGRVKMRKTSDVIAIVKAGNQLYSAQKSVKVTLGGCGG